MNASNNTTAKYFSDLLGKTTVKVETSNLSKSKQTSKEGGTLIIQIMKVIQLEI